jgi:hypothetical protein
MVRPPLCLLAVLSVSFVPAYAGSLEDLIQAGVVPKMPSSPISRTALFSRVPQGNSETTVFLSRRKAGTRTPIHTHYSGGITCLIEGAETLFIENQKPQTVVAPGCIYMPSGVRMMSLMSGEKDTVYYSIFTGEKGFAYWDVKEKGVSGEMKNDFERFQHQH